MKKLLPLIAITAFLSLISGILLSKMSALARISISVFHKHYRYYTFMKTWWKGALFFFSILLFLIAIQSLAQYRMNRNRAILFQVVCLLIALAGLYYNYYDFRHVLSHRWAGERFHLGFYLFWINWGIISVYMLTVKKPEPPLAGPTGTGNTGVANP